MNDVMVLPLVMRWAHIFAAVIAVGGVIFMRFVLAPAAKKTLTDDQHEQLRTALTRRWKMVVHLCILLFLVSGFYNYLFVARLEHSGQALYHMLFGIKFLLALGVFFVAIGLTSSKPWAVLFRERRALSQIVLVVLAAAVICVGGYMKVMPKSPATPPAEAAAPAE